jgi:hypothetical protein
MNRSPAPFFSALACFCSLSLPLGLAGACGSLPGEASAMPSDDETATSVEALRSRPPAFLDITEMFSSEDDQNRWFDLTFGLRHDFDDICGDTFCEGDFSNLQSMSFQCSASTRTGQLKTCLWLFAGSSGSVTASTGNVRPGGKFFACSIPVTGTAHALLDALLAPDGERGPLWRPLPGTTQSIYDHLGDCL